MTVSLEPLLRAGTIEIVAPDTAAAQAELTLARTHLESAALLLETDPVLAHAAAYDAARKSVSAHMRARGYRVKGQIGHHAKTFEYARAVLVGHVSGDVLDQLDDMRSVRNDAAYRARFVGRQEVEADLEIARIIVEAVAEDL